MPGGTGQCREQTGRCQVGQAWLGTQKEGRDEISTDGQASDGARSVAVAVQCWELRKSRNERSVERTKPEFP